MSHHLVLGSGPIGSSVSRQLLEVGHEVTVVTRSGTGIEGTTRVAADAADADRMSDLAQGMTAIYNCINPPYHQWASVWPPISSALLQAAGNSGAVLATTANLYNYGRVDAPMTEATPEQPNGIKGKVRKQMWSDALAAHDRGEVRAFEARGSDYVGGLGQSLLSMVILPAWAKGKKAMVPAPLDVAHSWTAHADVARLLITGVADERAWGKVWHVPSDSPRTLREVADLAVAAGATSHGLRALPYAAVWAAGLKDPFVRELRETQHQFRRPFLLDSTAAQQTFGLTPTPLVESIAAEVAAFHRESAALPA